MIHARLAMKSPTTIWPIIGDLPPVLQCTSPTPEPRAGTSWRVETPSFSSPWRVQNKTKKNPLYSSTWRQILNNSFKSTKHIHFVKPTKKKPKKLSLTLYTCCSVICFWLDVSHLTVATTPTNQTTAQPTPTPSTPVTPSTEKPSDACTGVECLNDGLCVVDEGKATCRCVFWGCQTPVKSGAGMGLYK